MNVYQRFLDRGDPTYYGRFTFKGTRYLRNLGTPNKDEAFASLRKILRALEAGRFAEVDATKKRQDVAKLSAIFDTYLRSATIPLRTRKNNIGQFRAIVRFGVPASAGSPHSIDELPSTVLTGRLMRDFQSAKLTAAGANKLAQDTAAISANATRRQARSLFKPDLLPIYEKLTLPDLAAFLAVKPLPEPPKLYNLPDSELLAKIRTNAEKLRATDPNLYRIYILGSCAGLRKSEIKWARWTWITPHADAYRLRLATDDNFRPKGKRQRDIPLETSAYAALRALKIERLPSAPAAESGAVASTLVDYILDGSLTERGDKAFDRFSAWMKAQGCTRKKQAHELRKIYGSKVAEQAGISVAQDLLGHSSIKTTKDYYVGASELPQIKIFG